MMTSIDKYSSTVWPKQLLYFHCRLLVRHFWRFGVNRLETERFQWGLIPSCIHVVAIYTSPLSDCRAELGWLWHRYYRKSSMRRGPRGCGQFTAGKQLSQAVTLKSTAQNPSCWIQQRLSNLSSFMYELPGCPIAAGGKTLVPPHRNLCRIIPSELFIVHEGDIF